MARARNLKPSFFTNDLLAEIDPLGRLLFQGLWCLADREGRLEDRPKKIKAELLPYDDCDADGFLSELHEKGFILRYESGAKRYIQVVSFTKHQNPHVKEIASTIPAPCLHGASTVQVTEEAVSSAEQAPEIPERAGLIPLSLNPITDSGFPIEADAPEKPAPMPRGTRIDSGWIPSDTGTAFCRKERPDLNPRETANQFRDYWIAQPGTKGIKLDWEATWRNWVRNQRRNAGPPGNRPSYHDERAETIAGLTGRSRSNDDERTIDIPATRVASLAG